MKVYVVLDHNDEGYALYDGVYPTREAAEESIADYQEEYRCNFSILEEDV